MYKLKRVQKVGCTTLWLYVILLDCTLKMIRTVNFMLRIFNHIKKKKRMGRI